MLRKFSSTASLLSALVNRFCTFMATRGVALASTSSKLSRSILTALRSLSGLSASLGWPDRSASTPTTNGNSVFFMAPPVSTS